jgi:hypothetical protein
MLEVDDPITWDEVTKFLLGEVKRDLSLKNILKDNKNNIPLLASFYSLCSSVNTIYCAVSHADGAGALDGMKQLVILIFVTCLKTGQFGLRSLGDIASIIGSWM